VSLLEAYGAIVKGGLVSAIDLEFRIIHDVKYGHYRWRLRSAGGETVDYSQLGHLHKSDCELEVHRLRDDMYPGAKVRDLTPSGYENRLPSKS
jgi:uncharacterized protein YegP (UPF0339 family)